MQNYLYFRTEGILEMNKQQKLTNCDSQTLQVLLRRENCAWSLLGQSECVEVSVMEKNFTVDKYAI